MQALKLEYLQEVAKVKAEEEKHLEFFDNDDNLGCSYCCPGCGFQISEEAVWYSDFKEFNPLPSCTKCGTYPSLVTVKVITTCWDGILKI